MAHISQKPCRTPVRPSSPTLPTFEADILTAAELAQLLRIHPVTVRLKAASGEIPGRQVGNRWRFCRAQIMNWMSWNGQP